MILVIVACLLVAGAALYFVLDRPVVRDRRRNALLGGIFLTASAVAVVAGLAYGVAGWLSS